MWSRQQECCSSIRWRLEVLILLNSCQHLNACFVCDIYCLFSIAWWETLDLGCHELANTEKRLACELSFLLLNVYSVYKLWVSCSCSSYERCTPYPWSVKPKTSDVTEAVWVVCIPATLWADQVVLQCQQWPATSLQCYSEWSGAVLTVFYYEM